MANSITDINLILARYTKDINEDVDAVLKEGAKNAASTLKRESPKHEGDYAKSWTYKQAKGKASYVVYNKDHYELTHLLEHGHDVVAWGKKVGHTKAYPHIAKVEEMTNEWITQELEERLKNEH